VRECTVSARGMAAVLVFEPTSGAADGYLVACRSEFFTADAAGHAVDARMLLLSEQGFASVTVTTDAEPGNGCSATGR
jgi:hypothetical protein